MTQPPSYPMPPAGGPPPTAGGFAPPPGPISPGHTVPPQYAPPGHPPPGPHYAAPPPTLAPNGQPLASFADRLLAWMVDTAVATGVLLLLFMPVFLVIWGNTFTTLTRTNPDGTLVEPDQATMINEVLIPLVLLELGLLVLMLALYWLYHVEYLKRGGQTLGKKALKIRVVPLDPTRTLDRRMAARRWFVQYLAGSFVPGLSYLDGFWQLWDKPWQQCLHDRFAGTVVVKVSE
ncbi:RDD family protein [Micromonospora sp. WMMD812]|uniref:RDD family protein n=1 Tax=Micromonospora sp. WMMD812 TaxID=3015152 RepID=UPI00248B65BB|nr:RDD family protein [Micromonospora sp. WMMD812]WBB66092.1 RDD family protein [Micromonospora sp. WMMD812]